MKRSPICIVGMHRSGTSMVAKLLHEAGLHLGAEADLMPPAEQNPEGFYEHLGFVQLNDDVLHEASGAWDCPPPPGFDWEASSLDPFRERARLLANSRPKDDPWGWKDPRTSLTLPFWRSALGPLRTVVVIRNPLEVATSLHWRNDFPIEFGLILWRIYTQRILADTTPDERIVTHADAYFLDPDQEIARVLKFLGLDGNQDISALRAVALPELRHHRMATRDLEEHGAPAEVIDLYRRLSLEAGWWEGRIEPGDAEAIAMSLPLEGDETAIAAAVESGRMRMYGRPQMPTNVIKRPLTPIAVEALHNHVTGGGPESLWPPVLQGALRAFENGQWEEGNAACLSLLATPLLPRSVRELVTLSLYEYVQPLSAFIASTDIHPLTVPGTDDGNWLAPSPVTVGERMLALGCRSHGEEGSDALLTLDDDFRVTDTLPLRDETGMAPYFANVRPFTANGTLHAALVLFDPDLDDWTRAGVVDIVDGAYRNLRVFGPRAGYFDQGWMPLSTPGSPCFLAWWEPTEVIRLNWESGIFSREALRLASHVAERFSSGTQGVPVPGGYLLLVNETTTLEDDEEAITSRFVRIDKDFRLTDISPHFFVAESGEDVASGLARQGDQLVAGFTSAEGSALLMTMKLPEVLAMLAPIGSPGRRPKSTSPATARLDRGRETGVRFAKQQLLSKPTPA